MEPGMKVLGVGKRLQPFQHWEPIYIGTNQVGGLHVGTSRPPPSSREKWKFGRHSGGKLKEENGGNSKKRKSTAKRKNRFKKVISVQNGLK
jgi:hypothetical protein